MQRNAAKCKKCCEIQKMSRNAMKYNEMERNAPKCDEMQRNVMMRNRTGLQKWGK